MSKLLNSPYPKLGNTRVFHQLGQLETSPRHELALAPLCSYSRILFGVMSSTNSCVDKMYALSSSYNSQVEYITVICTIGKIPFKVSYKLFLRVFIKSLSFIRLGYLLVLLILNFRTEFNQILY